MKRKVSSELGIARLQLEGVKAKNGNTRAPMDILIVEDDVDVMSNLTQRIRDWGHMVENAGTCKGALGKARQKRFDLILLDIFLLNGKGHQLIPQLKELWPEVGIVTMTGYNSRELEMKVRKQGILYYMIKPFETKDLECLLDHLSIYLKKRDQQVNR